MRERNHLLTPLARWLDAERQDREEEAEAALLELCALLPPLAPSAGFADRVLRRLVTVPAPADPFFPRLFGSRAFRLVLAACLLATGVSLFWLPQALASLAGVLTFGDVVQLGVTSAIDVGHWLGIGSRIAEWLVTVVAAFAVSLTSPGMLKITAACLAISGVSFVVLRDLMTRKRSWSYVDSMR